MPAQATAAPSARGGQATRHRVSAHRIDRRMLIDGSLVEAESGQTLPSVNPASGEVIGYAPDCTVGDAERAIAAARHAFDTTGWSTDVEFRVECLKQLHAALVDHREELGQLTIAEAGATRRLTEGPYLDGPIDMVRYYADSLNTYPMTEDLGEVHSMGRRHRRWVDKAPAGVTAAVIASSHPTRLALAALSPAIAAGCTTVLKGAPETALITLALGELIATCTDIPAGVVNVLSSLDPAVDSALATGADVDVVTVTGTASAGRRLMAAASGTVKRIWLRLDRKSTAIVLDDADFSACAASIALMMTSNAGQGSAPISRLLVPRRHHDEMVDLVEKRLAAVRLGDPADPRTWMGPLIGDRQRDQVDGIVKRAVAAGAVLVTGGNIVRPGYFYEPTVLTSVDPGSEIAHGDISGPVLVVIPYGDDQDAVRIANSSVCGESGAVFGSHERALFVARGVRTGRMSINGGNYFGPDSRFGCAEEQAINTEPSVVAFEEFLERKACAAVISGEAP